MSPQNGRLRGARATRPVRDQGELRLTVAGQQAQSAAARIGELVPVVLETTTPTHDAEAALAAREAQLEAVAAIRAGATGDDEVVSHLTRVCEVRDDATHEHSQRIGRAARLIAEAMGLGETFGRLLQEAAPLHDVGKVGIPDSILLKPGRLTPEERAEMEQHTLIGQKILAGGTSEVVRMAEMVALSHHERWDGDGYPHGLKGDETPIGARIVAVVDVFDALTHERPYKRAWPLCEAVAHIVAGSGTHFDPAVVAAFRTVDPCDLLGDCNER